MELLQSERIFICQTKYTQEVFKRFGMDFSPVHNPIVPGCKLTEGVNGIKMDTNKYLIDWLMCTNKHLCY